MKEIVYLLAQLRQHWETRFNQLDIVLKNLKTK